MNATPFCDVDEADVYAGHVGKIIRFDAEEKCRLSNLLVL